MSLRTSATPQVPRRGRPLVPIGCFVNVARALQYGTNRVAKSRLFRPRSRLAIHKSARWFHDVVPVGGEWQKGGGGSTPLNAGLQISQLRDRNGAPCLVFRSMNLLQ